MGGDIDPIHEVQASLPCVNRNARSALEIAGSHPPRDVVDAAGTNPQVIPPPRPPQAAPDHHLIRADSHPPVASGGPRGEHHRGVRVRPGDSSPDLELHANDGERFGKIGIPREQRPRTADLEHPRHDRQPQGIRESPEPCGVFEVGGPHVAEPPEFVVGEHDPPVASLRGTRPQRRKPFHDIGFGQVGDLVEPQLGRRSRQRRTQSRAPRRPREQQSRECDPSQPGARRC